MDESSRQKGETSTRSPKEGTPFAAPSISLPKGGGAIRGMGEKFAANSVTGTGSMSVPIATSPGRSGFGQQLSLSYDSGAGNGPFGFGWSLSLPSIARKTDKGLPQYIDREESDVFILSGAEDLVPTFIKNTADKWVSETVPDRTVGGQVYSIKRYRPRIEGLFARIERWTNQANPEEVFWQSISKDNITTWYGKDENSRIADPSDRLHIFSWLICQSYDDKGNVIVYQYKEENSDNVDLAQANERNRTSDINEKDKSNRTANRYLKRIYYGNREPYLPKLTPTAWPQPPDPTAANNPPNYFFEVVFDYDDGHYAEDNPDGEGRVIAHPTYSAPTAKWSARVDPFSTYRAGFEVRTYRLCQRVLMFHHFPDELGIPDYLVRSTDFTYSYEDNPNDARNSIYSFLNSVCQSGYVRQAHDTYLKKSLPPLQFEYTKPVVQAEVHDVDPENLENLPHGLDGSKYQWVDLDGEGLSGILTEQGDAWFYKRNLSPFPIKTNSKEEVKAHFASLELIAKKPSLAALSGGGQQFLDLAGDGQLDLVALSGPTPGFFERTHDEDWEPFRIFRTLPNVDWSDPHLKFVDLTGDGHADILITEDDVFWWYPSLAEDGFGAAERVPQNWDEEKGPRLIFADIENTIHLADLNGDGLADLVRIRNGETCYWPNLGYGCFGAKVTMDNSPWFDTPDGFDPRRLQVADLDGSGLTDILYVGREGVSLYFNQAGNRWADAHVLEHFPRVDDLTSLAVIDLLGNGTACLVWSSTLPGDVRRQIRYIDLLGGTKPHLLVRSFNNLGAEMAITYAPSTKFYLQDKLAGKPWITKLPFPVHVVERVESYDRISRNRFITRYAYHHGYFDGAEREFRGFGMVEQWDTEAYAALTSTGELPAAGNISLASHVPPVHTKSWFHTGVYIDGDHVSNYFAGSLNAQDRGEYFREPAWQDDDIEAARRLLPDTVLPESLLQPDNSRIPYSLTAEEAREACRALKGSMLRQEIYALDAKTDTEPLYTITEQNFALEILQGIGPNRHAVFFAYPREAVSYNYERKCGDTITPADPRVVHTLSLDVDLYGNVLRSASVAYGRRVSDLSLPTDEDRNEQTRPHIACSENLFALPAPRADMWRTPLPYDARTFELTGLDLPLANLRFTFEEVRNAVGLATNIDYEVVPTAGKLQKRLIEHVRTRYRPDDLGVAANDPLALLPLGVVEPLAFAGESYTLAFTSGLVNGIFGARVTDAMLETEGRYVHTAGDTNWWIPSGRVFLSPGEADTATQELDYAKAHFFLPHRYRDPFHAAAFKTESFVRYDSYNLLIEETRDALGNRTSAGERDVNPDLPLKKRGNDYRVLQAQLLMDPNRNQSAVAFDALGLVVGAATMGKPEDSPRRGDLLQGFDADLSETVKSAHLLTPLADPHSILSDATSRMVYDLFAYQQTKATANPQPCVVYSLVREIHSADLPPGQKTPVQHSFSYFDGFGREILKKVQAEQGPVPKRDPVTGRIVVQNGLPEMTSADADVRWVGSGWTVFNNKGKPVRQYEPYFSDTHLFEFDVRIGVSPILFYDPLERVVGTLHPDHTWKKEVFDSWRQESFDVSDTVSIPDPQNDSDVGDYFNRLPSSEYLPTWFGRRSGGALGPQEQAAAQKAAVHANTQLVTHFDSLGRAFLTVAHNKAKYSDTPAAAPPVEEFFRARVTFDIEGNQRAVRDAKNRVVVRYDYDMPGNRIHQRSMEAGERWMLNNAAGKPLYAWDSRDHRFHFAYDRLHRPADTFLKEGAGAEMITARNTYGEAQANAEDNNLRGKLVELRDQTGIVSTRSCDFKGNVLRTERQLAHDYSAVLNWAAAVTMDAPVYSTRTRYDALNRPVQIIAPHSNQPGATVNILQRVYNEANLLNQVDAWLNQGAEPAGMLAGATADLHAVTNIAYDAKGRRTGIELGNGVKTTYRYDPFTLRLVSLVTRSAAVDLQNLQYTYDPKGNITHIRDDAQQSVFFRNQRVEPVAEYTYDAIYQLMEATGREHLGQLGGAPVPHSYNDVPRTHILHPGDRDAMGLYLERYVYDAAGNFVEIQHRGTDPANPGWTRTYTYGEASLIEATPGNRLTSTATNPLNPEIYSAGGNGYDEHGNLLRMPQLQEMRWDFKDQLRMTRRQAVNAADAAGNEYTGERTWYVYDAGGQRVRKVTESSPGVVKEERVYLGAFEIYRKNGVNPLVRETLHIMDDKQRVALIETRTQGLEAGVPQQLIRYQFSNHLGTAALELDDLARVISYEEHTPYGSTAYEAVASQTQTPRRYRFTGKERDEETGFTYHGARYYAPWLGRWTSCDPTGIQSGLNAYEYCRGTPVALTDANGAEPFDPQKGNWFTKALLYNTTPVVSDVLDFATNDRNLKHLQDYYTVVAITAGTIATGGLLEGAAIGLGATAIEAGVIGGFGGGMFSAYTTAGSQGRTPTTGEVLLSSGGGALTGGGMAFAQTKVIPAIIARTARPPSPPPTPRPPAPVLPPAPKPAAPPAAKPAAPAPAAVPVPPTPKPPDPHPPGTQLSLLPGEPPAAPKVEAPAAPPAGPEIPHPIDMGEVKSANWTPEKAIDYQGKFVFQESLDLKGGTQASIRYTRDYKLVVDLRELGGMEGPIGKTYVLQLDPAAAQKATAGMKFGTAAYGNALEPLAIQRVGQATGQVPVIRPPQQGGADFLPAQLGFRVLNFTF